MGEPLNILPYQPERDSEAVYALWQHVMGQDFPLSREAARKAFDSHPAPAYIAQQGGNIVGFASGQVNGDMAALQALLVAPEVQNQGIGTALHEMLLERLKSEGASVAQLGSGEPRIFPGVPMSRSQAVKFFESRGWHYADTSLDMIQPLADYFTPPGILERVAPQGIHLELCEAGRVPDVLTFVEKEFSSWLAAYQSILDLGDLRDVLLAVNSEQDIVGCLILYGKWSHPSRGDTIWQGLWGDDLGALGAVGTAESQRRSGIGSALVAYGTQMLKERGASHSFIGWTWAETFYSRLGYQVWQSYQMSWRRLTGEERA